MKPGSGPRHIALHPNGRWAYVISELANTVTAFDWDGDKGSFHELQTISTLPKDFKGENSTAEIAVDPKGRYLYGSNRGHDSIAVYAIDPAKGLLTLIEDVPTLGQRAAQFRARSHRRISVCRESEFEYRGGVPREPEKWPTDPDRRKNRSHVAGVRDVRGRAVR